MKGQFSRFNLFVTAMMRLIEKHGPIIGRQMSGEYKSRGKGGKRGKTSQLSKNYFKSGNRNFPFSNTRQDQRHASKAYMKVVNGFEIMQTLSGKQRREGIGAC